MKHLALLPLLLLAGCFSGCVAHNQTIVKSTVFGIQIGASPTGGIPSVQFGLIRNLYVSNPTSTNAIYAAPLATSATADISPLHQTGDENISTK